jgi:cytochrome P450
MEANADLDIFSPEARQNPYPCYHRLRERSPVHWNRTVSSWLLTRHSDCVAALRDPRLSSARALTGTEKLPEPDRSDMRPFAQSVHLQMVFRDPPEHTRLRNLVNRAFSPAMIARMRGRVSAVVDQLLTPHQKRLDVMAHFADRLPAYVIADLLGAPREDWDDFRRCSDTLGKFLGGGPAALPHRRAALESWRHMTERLHALAEDRRAHPREDLMSALVSVEERGEGLNKDELMAMCVLLFFGGHATTRDLIGNGLFALLNNPSQLERLRVNPSLMAHAVEELLRFDCPLQANTRVASEALEIEGVHVEKGQRVVAMLGAANRDPSHFSDPDRLDIARENVKHIAFGFGIHYCIGAPLARLEAEIALTALCARAPRLAASPDSLRWREIFGFRGLLSLPIDLD